MRRTILAIAALSLLGSPGLHARSAADVLSRYLQEATQLSGTSTIDYEFASDIRAFGRAERHSVDLRAMIANGSAQIEVASTPPLRIDLGAQALCRKDGEDWQCETIDATLLEENLGNHRMSLFPPTAMRLLQTLMTRHPHAVRVSGRGVRYVAGARCVDFHINLETAALPVGTLTAYSYLQVDQDRLAPFVLGTSFDVCLDETTHQVLHYETQMAIDQEAMVAQMIWKPIDDSVPVGTIRATLRATQIHQ